MISKISEKEDKGARRFPLDEESAQRLSKSSYNRLSKYLSRKWQMNQMGV